MDNRLVLPDVPAITGYEHADIFLDAFSIALAYLQPELSTRYRRGLFDTLSGFTGRGWLVGFEEAAYYWERYGVDNPRSDFACSSLEAYLSQVDTMLEAFRFAERTPELLWHSECAQAVPPGASAELREVAEATDAAGLRRYVADHLRGRRCPVLALLRLPWADETDFVLLSGYEDAGAVVLGRSLAKPPEGATGEYGYFRLAGWESEVLALVAIGEPQVTEWVQHPAFHAIVNGLRCGRSYSEGTRHYGLSAYDAWERALLDDSCLEGAADTVVSRRLLYHSMVAGTIACQKCFTAMPEREVPSMGVITNLVTRAEASANMIHGLMWDAWQVVGGYWRGASDATGRHRVVWTGGEELARFRERRGREGGAGGGRRPRPTDEEGLRDLAQAREDWERCRGHGGLHHCPCWGNAGCARV